MSDDIEVRENQTVAQRPIDKFGQYALDRAMVEREIVAQELGAAQGDAILNAANVEELDAAMEMVGLVGLRDFDDGTEIEIKEFHYAPGTRSDYKNRWGIFAVMDAVLLESGKEVAIDTGVERIILWLRAMENMGKLPAQRRITKVATGSGNEMITLLPLKKRVVKGDAD